MKKRNVYISGSRLEAERALKMEILLQSLGFKPSCAWAHDAHCTIEVDASEIPDSENNLIEAKKVLDGITEADYFLFLFPENDRAVSSTKAACTESFFEYGYAFGRHDALPEGARPLIVVSGANCGKLCMSELAYFLYESDDLAVEFFRKQSEALKNDSEDENEDENETTKRDENENIRSDGSDDCGGASYSRERAWDNRLCAFKKRIHLLVGSPFVSATAFLSKCAGLGSRKTR